MRRLRNSVILLSFIGLILIGRYNVALRAWAQTQAVAPNGLTALRIVSPKNGEKLQQNFVTVQYAQIQQASASSTPTFELQLDAQDPVHTATTSYTFTGLTPGPHDLIIQIVDANNTPVTGSRSEVRFTVLPQNANGTGTQQQSGAQNNHSQQPGNQNSTAEPPKTEMSPQTEMTVLPEGRSSLPLLSVIGFGILLGGIISALRTRPAANR